MDWIGTVDRMELTFERLRAWGLNPSQESLHVNQGMHWYNRDSNYMDYGIDYVTADMLNATARRVLEERSEGDMYMYVRASGFLNDTRNMNPRHEL